MIKHAKPFSEIVQTGKEHSECVKKWKENSGQIKKEFYKFIDKKNLRFYLTTTTVSCILIIISLFTALSNTWNNLLMSLACSFISGVIVSYFLEKNANKKWSLTQITKYNYDLSEVYSSIARITGYVLLSEVVIGNYAMNDYAKSKGINPIEGSNYHLLITEVTTLYNGKIDKIPYATTYASSYTINFTHMIERIISKTNEFLINYHDYLTDQQKKMISNISFKAGFFLNLLQGYSQKIYVPSVKTFDEIIIWAQETASEDFVLENYMQE